jgi:hypothetical protein
MKKRYQIGERSYVQRPLVLGQLQQLLPFLGSVKVKRGEISDLMGMFSNGNRISAALAVVLIDEGITVREALDRVEERAVEIHYSITADQILEVLEDFFVCNRSSSVLERLLTLVVNLKAEIERANGTSKAFCTKSPVEISPEGTTSYGA